MGQGGGHKEVLSFLSYGACLFHRRQDQDCLLNKAVEVLNEEARLAKAPIGETREERKWRETINDFLIDQFWFDILIKQFYVNINVCLNFCIQKTS